MCELGFFHILEIINNVNLTWWKCKFHTLYCIIFFLSKVFSGFEFVASFGQNATYSCFRFLSGSSRLNGEVETDGAKVREMENLFCQFQGRIFALAHFFYFFYFFTSPPLFQTSFFLVQTQLYHINNNTYHY